MLRKKGKGGNMVKRAKAGPGFGITSPVTGHRVYVGPFLTTASARAEMIKRHGKNKRLVRRTKFDSKP